MRPTITAILACMVLTALSSAAQIKPGAEAQLTPGQIVARELKTGETHAYLVNLRRGEFLHVEVDQRGIDVVIRFFAPDGTKLAELNNRHIDYGQEPLSFVATADGLYRLELTPSTTTTVSGRYAMRADPVRSVTSGDRVRIEAERAAAEGQRLRMQGKAESYRSALERYEVALKEWHEIGDRYWESTTLANIGTVYNNLGENQKALEAYGAALPLSQAVQDVAGEWRILNNFGAVYDSLGEKQKALHYYKQALPVAHTVGDRRGEAKTLVNVGNIYGFLREYQQALEFLNPSLALWHAIGDRNAEADTLNRIALAHSLLGYPQKALDYYNLALPLARAANNHRVEADTLVQIGTVLEDLGEKQKALDYYNQALPLRHSSGDNTAEASLLMNMGTVYKDIGEAEKAVDHYNRALQLAHEAQDKSAEAFALIDLGLVYESQLRSKQRALEYYNAALELRRAAGDRSGEASVLSFIGGLYRSFGESQKALDYHNQALALTRGPREARGEVANILDAIGSDYYSLGQQQKALEFYNQALQLHHATGRRKFEAFTLDSIGRVYDDLGEKQKALDAYNRALQLDQEIGDKSGEASALRRIGSVYQGLGEKQKALDYYHRTLPLERAIGDRGGEALTFIFLMTLEYRKPGLAIFYGKQAVSIYQDLRGNIQGLDKEVQETFLHSVEIWYRRLADLLISEGRLPEAQQVLGMLKEEEYFEFVRRDGNEATSLKGTAALTPEEAAVEKRYREVADRVTAIGVEYGQLRDKKTRTAAEEQQLAKLEGDLTVANQVFQKFLDEIDKAFSGSAAGSEKAFQLRESQGLMETLRDLGSGVVALYTVVGEDKYRVILITPEVQKAYEYPIKAADLNRRVLEFREALQNPQVDPRPLAQGLYRILVGTELARDLAQAKAQTLMWSLDGVLRYLPIAALHDGQEYLVERYRNVVFTPASQSRLKDSVSANWRGLGLGVSKAQPGFNPLPGVPEELRGIIRDERMAQSSAGSGQATRGAGVLSGTVMLDEAFTSAAMQTALHLHYPLVHIASHFQFHPGNETDSFLLLGDGSHLTLAQIKSLPNVFSGVDLLTLSACDTATGGSANGKEVEGFGVLAQRQGAKAVLATLWPVADESTQILMREFYRLHEANPQWTKAEALRQAQLALLKGNNGSDVRATSGQRSSERLNDGAPSAHGLPFKPDPNAKYGHPYYWAPFILIGNWK